jgi:thiazole synthase
VPQQLVANSVEPLRLGPVTIHNRLIVGTGKYATYEIMTEALEASGTEVVTVAVRRERLLDKQGRSLLDFIDTDRYTILPNTAGCFTAEDAVRVARLGRELLEQLDNPGRAWVKLEVLGDKQTLLPDPVGTLEACRQLWPTASRSCAMPATIRSWPRGSATPARPASCPPAARSAAAAGSPTPRRSS